MTVDVSSMPRFGRAPVPHSAEQADTFALARHPSMEDLGRRTLMWNLELQDAYASLAGYLRNSDCLPRRDREIAILRQAWDCGSDYEWALHGEMALDAGLSVDEIDDIASGADGGNWAPHEAAVIRAVDELDATCRIGDDTWNALVAHYDERQIIEFLVLVGNYRLLASVFNAIGIRPPGGQSPDLPGNSFLFTAVKEG
jgi:alkylhydroperoxidase family enzyme